MSGLCLRFISPVGHVLRISDLSIFGELEIDSHREKYFLTLVCGGSTLLRCVVAMSRSISASRNGSLLFSGVSNLLQKLPLNQFNILMLPCLTRFLFTYTFLAIALRPLSRPQYLKSFCAHSTSLCTNKTYVPDTLPSHHHFGATISSASFSLTGVPRPKFPSLNDLISNSCQ